MPLYLTDLGLVNPLGDSQQTVSRALWAGERGVAPCDWLPGGAATYTAPVTAELDELPARLAHLTSRNARLAVTALAQMEPSLSEVRERYGPHRVAVVAGTSTSGIAEGEAAVARYEREGVMPPDYHYRQQEIGNLAGLAARYCQVSGPAYTLSTACSSSAHALGSAQRLLESGLADAVIAGGSDSLCRLTVNGFAALDSVDAGPCNPFSQNRQGINIGEAAAFFLVTREPIRHRIELMGTGASSDAHHISAPDPEGVGARAAIESALRSAGVAPAAVDYVNLHGTGTPLNDAMESKVVHELFGDAVPASSSKGQIGHTLGAAGATEAALCWLSLTSADGRLPPHVWDGERDPELAPLRLVEPGEGWAKAGGRVCVSQSFAFGGNNAALVLGDPRE